MRCDNCGWSNPDGAERCQKCNQVLPQIQQPIENDPLAEILAAVNKTKAKEDAISEPVENQSKNCHKCGYPKLSADETCPNCGAVAMITAKVDADNGVESSEIEVPNPIEGVNNNQNLKATIILGDAIEQIEPKQPQQSGAPIQNTKQTIRDMSHIQGNMKATVRDFTPEKLAPKSTVAESSQPKVDVLKTTVKSGICLVAVDGLVENEPQSIFCDAESMVLNRANVDSANPSIAENEHAKISCEDGAWYIEDLSPMKNTYIRTDRKIRIEKGDMIIIGNRRYILQ